MYSLFFYFENIDINELTFFTFSSYSSQLLVALVCLFFEQVNLYRFIIFLNWFKIAGEWACFDVEWVKIDVDMSIGAMILILHVNSFQFWFFVLRRFIFSNKF